jgi:pyrroloquinoline quinone biosynthesis protein E
MDGWARRFIHVTPTGLVMPCHAATSIRGITFDSVRGKPLAWIWRESASMRAFRGDEWMEDPCKSCERRHTDFGGCRCQAFALTGRAAATDPACSLSPGHPLVTGAARAASIRYLHRGKSTA